MKAILKCYKCGENRIGSLDNETFNCHYCGATLDISKCKKLVKSEDNEKLRKRLMEINKNEQEKFENDFDVSDEELNESYDIGGDKKDFLLKVIEKEDKIEKEELKIIWENSNSDTDFEKILEELRKNDEIILSSSDKIRLV